MAAPLDIRVHPSVADRLALGVIALADIVPGAPDGLADHIQRIAANLRALLGLPAAMHDFIEPGRRLYKDFGIDPTKHRPSSEQLLRRLIRGDPFPRVSPLVDAMNLCQLQERLPYGLYDLDAIEPPVLARAGVAGEGYEGIRKGPVSVEGRPALFDARGPFGNPTSDSDRAKTGETTERALVVIFGSPEMAASDWEGVLDRTAETLLLHVRAVVVEERVVFGGGP